MSMRPPWGSRSTITAAKKLLIVALSYLAGASGCTRDACTPGAPDCDRPKVCVDEDCAGGERCVDNVCSPPCDTDQDCPGAAECELMITDFGTRGRYCLGVEPEPEAEGGTSEPGGSECQKSTDCDDERVEYCIAGECRAACLIHEHCGQAGACTGQAQSVEGESVALCEPDSFKRSPGGYGSRCLNGSADCDSDFMCIAAGEGDTDSYCTQAGCESDAECPSGYYCHRRSAGSTPPCATVCGLAGDPTNPNCIAVADIGRGKPFSCSTETEGLVLTRCFKRDFCVGCETDADCRGFEDQVCARGIDGTKICTTLCDEATPSCPWGNASVCGVFDSELGMATCSHRAGSCRQAGNSCDPCVDDLDCPFGFCAGSDYSGERFCYDARADCSCPTDDFCVGGGCPTTPGGLEMNCVPRTAGAAPDVCYGAMVDSTDQASGTGCWPRSP